MEDLERITLEEAKAYFQTYYAPNNAIMVLAGDVEPEVGAGAGQEALRRHSTPASARAGGRP